MEKRIHIKGSPYTFQVDRNFIKDIHKAFSSKCETCEGCPFSLENSEKPYLKSLGVTTEVPTTNLNKILSTTSTQTAAGQTIKGTGIEEERLHRCKLEIFYYVEEGDTLVGFIRSKKWGKKETRIQVIKEVISSLL